MSSILMMTYKTIFQLLLFSTLWLTLLIACTTPNSSATRTISKFAVHQADEEHGSFYEKSLKITYGKLDSSQNTYFVAMYTLEGFNEGNDYQQRLAVFVNGQTGLTPIHSTVVSKKINGSFDKLEIKDKEIVLSGKMIGPNDPLCCPTVPVRTLFKLKDQHLVHTQGTKLTH